MSSTRKRKATTARQISSESSEDELDKLVRAKKRKATDDNNIDNDAKVVAAKTAGSKKKTTTKKVITKAVLKKTKAKTHGGRGNSSDESPDEDVKLISVDEKDKTKAPVDATRSRSTAGVSGTANHSSWTDEQLLAEIQHIDYTTSANIIRLFNNDNTIPFVCRYRRELIGDLNPDQ